MAGTPSSVQVYGHALTIALSTRDEGERVAAARLAHALGDELFGRFPRHLPDRHTEPPWRVPELRDVNRRLLGDLIRDTLHSKLAVPSERRVSDRRRSDRRNGERRAA